jgi:YD repeat-containing protein
MQKTAVLFVFFLFALSSMLQGQYYYQDIISNKNNNDQFQLMKKEKVTKVHIKSLESTGETTEGFSMEQSFNNSYTQLKTTTQIPGAKERSVLINYYNLQGYLYRTVDSSENAITVYEYGYDTEGKLVSILNTSRSAEDKLKTTESHTWIYSDKGFPEKMIRVRENADTMEIRLLADKNGNVGEEQSFRKGIAGDKVYYYYNENGKLTDIVRYQDKLGKLIPDYTFDYSPEGNLSEMMVVQQSGKDYLVWKYEYNSNGLKKREAAYNRQKRLAGSVEYSYEMKK